MSALNIIQMPRTFNDRSTEDVEAERRRKERERAEPEAREEREVELVVREEREVEIAEPEAREEREVERVELVVREEREVKRKRESEGGSKGKSKICFVCGPVEAKKMGRHLDYQHLPWWISPDTACWTCQQAERSLAFLRARHSNCGGYWETEDRFRRWVELVLELLDLLRASLGCATLEDFLGLVDSMGLEEEPVSHGQKCIINALSLVTGEHLISVNCPPPPPPASLAELSARPVIRALLPLLQRNQLEAIRKWNRPFAVAPFPGEVRTIDSHCHVDTLVARGARVVDLFSGNGARLDLILCSLNFPARWDQVSRLGDDRLRWTVGFHPHVTSQHIPEPVWERHSVCQNTWLKCTCWGIIPSYALWMCRRGGASDD